jgi:hypothetical protein
MRDTVGATKARFGPARRALPRLGRGTWGAPAAIQAHRRLGGQAIEPPRAPRPAPDHTTRPRLVRSPPALLACWLSRRVYDARAPRGLAVCGSGEGGSGVVAGAQQLRCLVGRAHHARAPRTRRGRPAPPAPPACPACPNARAAAQVGRRAACAPGRGQGAARVAGRCGTAAARCRAVARLWLLQRGCAHSGWRGDGISQQQQSSSKGEKVVDGRQCSRLYLRPWSAGLSGWGMKSTARCRHQLSGRRQVDPAARPTSLRHLISRHSRQGGALLGAWLPAGAPAASWEAGSVGGRWYSSAAGCAAVRRPQSAARCNSGGLGTVAGNDPSASRLTL